MRPHHRTAAIVLTLVAVVFAVFFRTLESGFLRWDDDINVFENERVQGLTAANLRWMFTDFEQAIRYKPLSWLAWALVHEAFGLNPFGYHLANVLLHCANAVLLFFLLRRLLRMSASPVGRDSVEPHLERSEVSAASISGGDTPSQETRDARASSVGKWGSTESHPTGLAGFTVCPPKGADLPQQSIRDALAGILELGFPTALYQLPQVTQNEMSPETLADLAARFPNFILFKDTSGADRVANSGRDFSGVFLVRGAEGGYANWLKPGGGPYDGFLLSTANCFGRELHQLIELLGAGRRDEAQRLSDRLSAVVKEVFALVAGLSDGNAFANANKAMDHFFAHGPNAARVTQPRLHAGSRLPVEVIRQTGAALERNGFLPERGYLE